jgi:hypothetical protein
MKMAINLPLLNTMDINEEIISNTAIVDKSIVIFTDEI